VPGERLADGAADLAGGTRGHQREHRAAEPPADHPRAVRARGQGRLDRRVGFGPGDLEVVAQRRVRLRQQPPDRGVGARRSSRAQPRDHLQDALVVRDHVPGATTKHRIVQPVEVTQVR
jgi:hypothetical protein